MFLDKIYKADTAWAQTLLEVAFWEILFSTLVCGAVLALTWALRHRSPGLRLALWSLVLVRLVLPPDLAAPWSARTLLENSTRWLASASVTQVPEFEVTTGVSQPLSSASAVALPGNASLGAGAPWQILLLTLWGLGSLLYFTLFALRRRHFHRILVDAQPIEAGPIFRLLKAWRRRLGVRRTVRLVTSAEEKTPFTMGVLRPCIFLPRKVLDHQDKTLIEGILAHELAHVRRFDEVLLLSCRLLQGLYFFHPAVWLAAQKINDEAEQICDALVLQQESHLTSRAYGRSLLTILRMNLESAEPMAAFGNTKRSFKMRLQGILSSNEPPADGLLRIVGLAFLVGIFLLPLAGTHAETTERPSEEELREIGREQARERLRTRLLELPPLAEPEEEATLASALAYEQPGLLSTSDASVLIVVHADNPTVSLSRQDLMHVFLKKKSEWWPGAPITPVDQSATTNVRRMFSRNFLGKDVNVIHSFWQRMVYGGRDVPPPEVNSDSEVIDYVRQNPGAIGYVAAGTYLRAGVRVLQVTDL